jgi:3',5'-cyclic AMP phosphodiesterase CpdA
MPTLHFPPAAKNRGPGFWMRGGNLLAAHRKYTRPDHSTEWRDAFPPAVGGHWTNRTVPFDDLLAPDRAGAGSFRFLILGDTGEGDHSQYGLLPVIRALEPDFMVIAGDVAYPAGRINGANPELDDYLCGLFQPYRNLNCPIWAVPGNHEYYSDQKGWEFFQIFCTQAFAPDWHEHGLRFVCQPGTYWELSDPDERTDLVVIGLDTGQCANLDGDKSWWQFWKSRPKRDDRQHGWLRERLARADEHGQKVIVLFHIPGLVRCGHDKSTHMGELHHILASHPCVRLVVAGHEHNFQEYDAGQFAQYLEEVQGARLAPGVSPRYWVAGGSGAYLTATDFREGRYHCTRYPTEDQWVDYAGVGRRLIAHVGLDKTPIARAAALFEKCVLTDADVASYLSLILVDVTRRTNSGRAVTTVTPVFMDDLAALYPGEMDVDVQTAVPPVASRFVSKCVQSQRGYGL